MQSDMQLELRVLVRSLYQTVNALSTAAESRDPYTVKHQSGVATLARVIGQRLGLDSDTQHAIRMGAMLHDIGKIAIPSEILNKPTKLLPQELELIYLHPVTGFDILKNLDFPWPVAEIVLQHHERIDGSGYPNGLKGENIRMESRIIAVADTIEALLVNRPYRTRVPMAKLLGILDEARGKQLDAQIVDVAVQLLTTRKKDLLQYSAQAKDQPVVQAILESE